MCIGPHFLISAFSLCYSPYIKFICVGVCCCVLLQSVKLKVAVAFPFFMLFAVGFVLNLELFWLYKAGLFGILFLLWRFTNT